jgi:hypothetical protein
MLIGTPRHLDRIAGCARAECIADPEAITALFTSGPANTSRQSAVASAGFAYQVGNLLTNTDGLVTFLTGRVETPANLASVLLTGITGENNAEIASLRDHIGVINREATQQADSLRAQYNASETHIAQLLALQTQISAIGHEAMTFAELLAETGSAARRRSGRGGRGRSA